MPLYLNERQVGFDTQRIGFPNIGGCMALALEDEGGLFGFHVTPGDIDRVTTFVEFMQNNRNYHGRLTHLYSACRWDQRYGGSGQRSDWEHEVTQIAAAIGYTGPVSGFNAGEGTKLQGTEAVYLELRLQGSGISFHHKRMGKLTDGTAWGQTSTDDDLREITADATATNAHKKNTGEYKAFNKLTPSLGRGHTSSVTLTKSTWGNKGELHRVPSADVLTFRV